MRISDWSSDVCSSDLVGDGQLGTGIVDHAATPWACRGNRREVMAARVSASCTMRSEEHTSELQSLMRISYAVFCLKKKTNIILVNNMNTTVTSTLKPYRHTIQYRIPQQHQHVV